MGIFNIKRDKVDLSLPQERILHGVKIKKLPAGAYLKAIKGVNNLPELLLKEAFPELSAEEILTKLKTLNIDTLTEIAGRLFAIVPEQCLRFIADLTDCPYEKFEDELTPNEILEILVAFWEINDLSNFMKNLKGVIAKSPTIKNLMGIIGM